ncbi:hypothetical protein [Flavilitoribacter nigricans]|uniref:DUF3108 domain-containing protein n=1 Tax=Flavilitoribacter nigricans (strain ATCC 23147 / DSM 23189 / NBRC 102662 / NCIMB 1420 / SS-2) TaxID=1122177 RepID=A0A2D0N090_FLAN2|nr:hypothetical protein [Flavilitoribacter nigricans]PHN01850.1 hypothetical protein CRP01_35020 [Flavilitoribacter nigricans DSM 23189 = NBRC 102662]
MRKWLVVPSLALFLLPGQAFAQGAQGMLIYQIEGNRYLRKNYDAKGILKNYQTIEVGKLNINNDIIESKMTVLSYDEEDNLLNASQTTIRCNPEAQEVLMGIFPFAGGKPNKSLKIEMPERNELYPSGWQQGNSLPNFNFRLKLEGGAAGFFGTESRTTISQRKVSLQSEGTYRVSGKMTLKAFVAGIRISTTVYDYFEDITAEKGIVRQNFRASDGEYFTITLIEK